MSGILRNHNILTCGGSGSGKTRFFAKPNIMNANTSFVCLDPKGELLRDTGNLLKAKGYDIRVAQYENGSRYPKDEVIDGLAGALEVHPKALALPDIDSYVGLLHTLFALEDLYGIRVSTVEGEPFLFVDKTGNKDAAELHSMLLSWSEQVAKLENGEINREDYDRWRYRYPEFDTTKHWVKTPSKRFSDMIVKAFKDKAKD